MNARHIAHYNVARLRAMPGDPLVAEFIDNVPRVNALAERSPGFIWRYDDEHARVAGAETFEAVLGDPLLAVSLSVWETLGHFRHFVLKTLHGAFLRRREAWFERWNGPNYVIWPVAPHVIPSIADGQARLAMLAALGPTEDAYDFAFKQTVE